MKPPICEVCDERFDPGDGGRRIAFVATAAGRRFAEQAERGMVGDPPDEGWFCRRHAAEVEPLADTHTLIEAVRSIRPATSPPRSAAAFEERAAAARDRFEQRRQTRVKHAIRPTPRGRVADEVRHTIDAVLERLELAGVDAETGRETSTSPSPEWRESATTTTIETSEAWTSSDHEVTYRYRDTVWDSWSGEPRRGDLFQGTISLTVDDTWLFASFGSDGIVTELDESGTRTAAAADLLDDLIARLAADGAGFNGRTDPTSGSPP